MASRLSILADMAEQLRVEMEEAEGAKKAACDAVNLASSLALHLAAAAALDFAPTHAPDSAQGSAIAFSPTANLDSATAPALELAPALAVELASTADLDSASAPAPDGNPTPAQNLSPTPTSDEVPTPALDLVATPAPDEVPNVAPIPATNLAPEPDHMVVDTENVDFFPNFAKGDVFIRLSKTESYKLHSQTLSLNSTYFADLLSSEKGIKIPPRRVKAGDTLRFRLGFDLQNKSDWRLHLQNEVPNAPSIFEYLGTEHEEEELRAHKAVGNFLRAIHHVDLDFNHENLISCVTDGMNLWKAAECHDGTHLVGKLIESHILQHEKELYETIFVHPLHWIELGFKLRSELIFREALVHVIGRWNMIKDSRLNQLSKPVFEACYNKHCYVFERKMAIEVRIGGFFPQYLQRHGDGSDISRATYASELYSWIALSLFKTWFGQAMAEGRGSRAWDGGFRLYTQIEEGGPKYLDKATQTSFHRLFEMTDKGERLIAKALSDFKVEVKRMVKPLLVNNTHLDPAKHNIKYLLSCPHSQADCPWIEKSQVNDDGMGESSGAEADQSVGSGTSDSEDRGSGMEIDGDTEAETDIDSDNQSSSSEEE